MNSSKRQKKFPGKALQPAWEQHKILLTMLQPENKETSRYQSAAGAQ